MTYDQYGWDSSHMQADSRSLLAAALEQASTDAHFGLPRWAKGGGREDSRVAPLILFGVSEFTHTILYVMRGRSILAIVDDNRLGEEIGGVSCISSAAFLKLYAANHNAIVVNCARFGPGNLHFKGLAMIANAKYLNFEQFVRLFKPLNLDYRVADWLPSISENSVRYAALENRLTDDLSKETLRRVLLFHLTTCRDFFRSIERPYDTLYFRSGVFDPHASERFIDCGASIGESISNLLEIMNYRIDRAWLFEPDRLNAERLQRLIAHFGGVSKKLATAIELLPLAVGDSPGRAPFRHMGGHGGNVVSALEPEDYGEIGEVQVVALDDTVDSPTLIKMDIEGFEMRALVGAKGIIGTRRPRLCISAYHRPSDLLEITDYVLSIRPDYKVDVRHHTSLRWDTCLYFH